MKKRAKMICMLLVLLLCAGMIAGCGDNKTGTMREIDVFGTRHFFEFTAKEDFGYFYLMVLKKGDEEFMYPEDRDIYNIYYNYVSASKDNGLVPHAIYTPLWKGHTIMISYEVTDFEMKAIKIISDSYEGVEYTHYLKRTT